MPFKKILVPVDYSDPSRRAIEHAVRIAAESAGEVVLLRVVPLTAESLGYVDAPQVTALLALMSDGVREHETAGMARLASEAVPEEMEAKVEIVQGRPAPAIVKTAAEGGFDLVVMGTHGRRGVERALVGSVAEHVIRSSKVPVLIVH